MYVNEKFKNAITTMSPQVSMRLTFDNPEEIISADNFLINASLEFVCDSLFGELPTKQLKATFMYESKKSYLQRKCFVEIAATDDDRITQHWIPIGYFFVAENGQETNEVDGTITLTAYDTATRLDIDYKSLNFPMTGKQIVKQITQRNGITVSDKSQKLLLDDLQFKQLGIGDTTQMFDREVLKHYLQINMASAFIDRFGELRIYNLFEKKTAAESMEFSYDAVSLKLEPKFGPVNALVYGRRVDKENDEEFEYITEKDQESIDKNDMTPVRFYENIFIDTLTEAQRKKVIKDLFTLINGYTYTPFEIEMFGRPDFDAGDVVSLESKDDGTFIVPLTSQTFEYNGGLMGTLKTKEMTESLTNYEKGYINRKIESLQKGVDDAIISANGKNQNYYGPFEPEKANEGDTWYKEIDDRTEIYIYVRQPDGTFEWVRTDADIGEIKEQVNNAEKEAAEANSKANDAVDKANANVLAITNTNKHLDDVEKDATQAKLDSQQALKDAQKAAADQKALDLKVTGDINRVDGVLATTVKQTEFNNLDKRVKTAETNITQNKNDIALRATKTEVNLIDNKVNQVDAQLKIESGKIITLTTKTDGQQTQIARLQQDYTGLNSTVSTVKTSLENLNTTTRNEIIFNDILPQVIPAKDLVKNNFVARIKSGDVANTGIMVLDTKNVKKNTVYMFTYKIRRISGTFANLGGHAGIFATNGSGYKIYVDGVETPGSLYSGLGEKFSNDNDFHTIVAFGKTTATFQSNPKLYIQPSRSIAVGYEAEVKDIAFYETNILINDWYPAPEDLVSTEEFSMIDQKVNSIQMTVGTKANQSQVTQLDNQITSVVKQVDAPRVNYFENATFRQGTDKWRATGGDALFVGLNNGYQPFSNNYIGVTRTVDAKASWFTQISNSVEGNNFYKIAGKKKWIVSGWYHIGATSGGITLYHRVTKSDGSFLYFNESAKKYDVKNTWTYFEYKVDLTSYPNITDIRFSSALAEITNGRVHFANLQIEEGEVVTPFVEYVGDTATQSQITQLTDNINLRVQKGEVINQINISTEGILISPTKLHISGKTYIENATITSAMIKDMSADKISTGTLNAAKVRVINLDANNISTGTLNAININGSKIVGSTFETNGENNLFSLKLQQGNIYFNRNSNGDRMGIIYGSRSATTNDPLGFAIGQYEGYEFSITSKYKKEDGYKRILEVPSKSTGENPIINISGNINMYGHLDMHNWKINNVANLVSTVSDGWGPVKSLIRTSKDGSNAINQAYIQALIGNGTAWGIDIWHSDARYKQNIKDAQHNASSVIEAIRIRDFDWVDSNKNQRFGVVAQELELIDEDYVSKIKQPDGDFNYQVRADALIPVLIKALQETNEKLNKLEMKINGKNY